MKNEEGRRAFDRPPEAMPSNLRVAFRDTTNRSCTGCSTDDDARAKLRRLHEAFPLFEKALSKAVAILQAGELEDLEAEPDLEKRAARLFYSELQVVCSRSLALILSVNAIYPEGWWVQGRIPRPAQPHRQRYWPRRYRTPQFPSLFASFKIDLGNR